MTQSGKVFTFGESEGGKLGLGDEVEDQYFSPQVVFGAVLTRFIYTFKKITKV